MMLFAGHLLLVMLKFNWRSNSIITEIRADQPTESNLYAIMRVIIVQDAIRGRVYKAYPGRRGCDYRCMTPFVEKTRAYRQAVQDAIRRGCESLEYCRARTKV